MSTAEDLSAAVREVAAHEAHIATLMARIDEMRDHLDQAGVRLHAAETLSSGASANSGGCVKFTLSKEMMHGNFGGTDRVKFSDWEFRMSNFLSAGEDEHAGDILEWIT